MGKAIVVQVAPLSRSRSHVRSPLRPPVQFRSADPSCTCTMPPDLHGNKNTNGIGTKIIYVSYKKSHFTLPSKTPSTSSQHSLFPSAAVVAVVVGDSTRVQVVVNARCVCMSRCTIVLVGDDFFMPKTRFARRAAQYILKDCHSFTQSSLCESSTKHAVAAWYSRSL
jgi:hypothetical protein